MPAFKYAGETSGKAIDNRPNDETTPLISVSGPSKNQESASTSSPRRLSSSSSSSSSSNIYFRDITFHSSDESGDWFLDFIMEKVKDTKIGYWADKLAVESEPGLTNAQLMLNNHDLKPGGLPIFVFGTRIQY